MDTPLNIPTDKKIQPQSSGCGFAILAIFLPPVALWWAYKMPKEQPGRWLRLAFAAFWTFALMMAIVNAPGDRAKKEDVEPKQLKMSKETESKSELELAAANPAPAPAPTQPTPSPLGNQLTAVDSKVDPDTPVRPSVAWSEIDRIYNLRSKSTKVQKEQAWKTFEGRTVEWSGKVFEVQETFLGGLQLLVKMNSDTLTFDVRVQLADGQQEAAAKLAKGDRVKFSGTLASWGQVLEYASVQDGVIH